MQTNKQEITDILRSWLENYLKKHYSNEFFIEVNIPESNLSKLAIDSIKSIPGFSSFDFKPDILGILKNKKTRKIELVFLNRSTNAISLKEIGEMLCYSKISQPILSFIASPKGLPNEVNLLLLNKERENQLLSYSSTNKIIIFKWNSQKNYLDLNSIFPLESRNKI